MTPHADREQVAIMFSWYCYGWSMQEVAAKFDVPVSALALWFAEGRLPVRRVPCRVATSDMWGAYMDGRTLAEVGKLFGTSPTTVRRHFAAAGLRCRQRGRPRATHEAPPRKRYSDD